VKCHCPWRRTSILLPTATLNFLPIVSKPPFGWPIVATFVEEKSIRRVAAAAAVGVAGVGVGGSSAAVVVVDVVDVVVAVAVAAVVAAVVVILFRCRPTIVVAVIFSFFLRAQIQVSHNIFCDLPMRVRW